MKGATDFAPASSHVDRGFLLPLAHPNQPPIDVVRLHRLVLVVLVLDAPNALRKARRLFRLRYRGRRAHLLPGLCVPRALSVDADTRLRDRAIRLEWVCRGLKVAAVLVLLPVGVLHHLQLRREQSKGSLGGRVKRCVWAGCAPSVHTWTSRGMGIPMVLSKVERLTNSAGSIFRVSACQGAHSTK